MRQARRVLRVIRTGGGLRALLTWRPFSVSSFLVVSALREHGVEPRTVIDAGAHVGQFARAATQSFPNAAIVCFEPLPDAAANLRRHLADRPDVRVVEAALSDRCGTATLQRNRYSHASSLLRLRQDASKRFPNLQETGGCDVTVTTLDAALGGDRLEPPVLLKLDIQGSELAALGGGSRVLERVEWVLVEGALAPLYEREPPFADVRRHLESRGLRYLATVDTLTDRRGEAIQVDALFGRRPGAPPA